MLRIMCANIRHQCIFIAFYAVILQYSVTSRGLNGNGVWYMICLKLTRTTMYMLDTYSEICIAQLRCIKDDVPGSIDQMCDPASIVGLYA